ncbi:MAG: acyl-CoA dehydrogenase [Sphingomonadales bacterium]|nr:acyl-CoA dehydrogenase [Sphingomonadales bacterium]MBU3993633.1 acyl-CoA dehydrogenase family protein [Alphaproteobacteria bacterium]
MHFESEPGLEEFRQEVRDFVRDNLPEDMKARQVYSGSMFSNHDDDQAWSKIVEPKGWGTYTWPVELGGCGWSAMKQFAFEDELYKAYAPPLSFNTLHMIGPVLYKFGSPELQERFLPMIRKNEIRWCQGFSEPGSGSDLASLRTRADLVDGKYVVNGQKIWTSGAYDANWCFCLVKTDTTCKPQKGMSFLLIDMTSPGITVRTIPQINNEKHLCEVFFDNVEVPVANLIGEAGLGWTYAKKLLEGERTTSSYIFWNKREMRRVIALANAEALNGNPVAKDPAFRMKLARIQAELTALEWSVLRVLANETFPQGTPAAASVLKVRGSDLQQWVTEAQVDLIGDKALRSYPIDSLGSDAGTLWPEHVVNRTNMSMIARAATIYGGSKQVQRNILAATAFGL